MTSLSYRLLARNFRSLRCYTRPQSLVTRYYSSASKEQEQITHFGFKNIPESQKEELVGKVFANVANKYDLMNDAMSCGIHRIWKDHFIRELAPGPGTKLLDVAGGTGDIAMRFLDYCHSTHGDDTAQVKIVDINPNMLEVGKQRFANTRYHGTPQLEFQVDNAEQLNIPSESVDAYTIAFGIRNCTHIDRVLREAHRVLKKGGRFMCLEFSQVNNPALRMLYDAYSFNVIPQLGGILANDKESYQYLVESIRKFPPQPEFARMIREAGFTTIGKGWEDLTFGVAAIHTGFKL
ncbi:uncharacterized protein VTP21DRAFT_11085 [Calcarisporiella thermophila]|uniref:uncharacterized protein n=1 Tax=Calcarisporiella thermophila TaxID=911321 RepID=UPI0037446616